MRSHTETELFIESLCIIPVNDFHFDRADTALPEHIKCPVYKSTAVSAAANFTAHYQIIYRCITSADIYLTKALDTVFIFNNCDA